MSRTCSSTLGAISVPAGSSASRSKFIARCNNGWAIPGSFSSFAMMCRATVSAPYRGVRSQICLRRLLIWRRLQLLPCQVVLRRGRQRGGSLANGYIGWRHPCDPW